MDLCDFGSLHAWHITGEPICGPFAAPGIIVGPFSFPSQHSLLTKACESCVQQEHSWLSPNCLLSMHTKSQTTLDYGYTLLCHISFGSAKTVVPLQTSRAAVKHRAAPVFRHTRSNTEALAMVQCSMRTISQSPRQSLSVVRANKAAFSTHICQYGWPCNTAASLSALSCPCSEHLTFGNSQAGIESAMHCNIITYHIRHVCMRHMHLPLIIALRCHV